MQVRLIAVSQPVGTATPALSAEELLVYCARVSSPQNQDNLETGARLLRYCVEHGHWSVFETASMTVEIETSRAIAAQILRHRSFTFQEFSQRYSKAAESFAYTWARRQDTKNRQSSHDDLSINAVQWFNSAQDEAWTTAWRLYEEALRWGIAKEQARFLLPLGVTTRLYMTGSVRSWIHYLQQRLDQSAQKEHRDVAEAIRGIFNAQFPITAEACGLAPPVQESDTENQ